MGAGARGPRGRRYENERNLMDRQELDQVIYEKEGRVARIILNRPEKASAQNAAMVWDVDRCLTDAERDYDVKVLILKANGGGFCAGHEATGRADIGERCPEFAAASE